MEITALYSRVSTLEQAKEGYSINAQNERLQAYAKAKDLPNPVIYSDPGISGANMNRPKLQEMINDIKNGQVQTVVVYKLDRLSRSQKDTLTLVQDLFNKNNVDFVSLEENIDTSTPMGIAMIGVLSAFAELERSTFKMRTALGREERAKQGYYHGGGNYDPLGYDYVDGELIVNEYEAKIVREIYKLYIYGNSMNEVARIIRQKYPDWIKSFTIVRDALKKSLYIGYVSFNGNEYVGKHEPILDEQTYYKAQKLRKQRSTGATKTNKRKGLLVGKIYCAHCGARYHREVNGSRKYRYIWYSCYSKNRSRATAHMVKDPNCQNKRWKEDELDQEVIRTLQDFDFSGYKKQEENKKDKIKQKQEQLERVDNQISKLIDLYTMDLLSKLDMEEKAKHLKDKKQVIEDDITEIKSESSQKEKIYSLEHFDWEKATKKEQMQLIDTVVDWINIDNDKLDIHLNF